MNPSRHSRRLVWVFAAAATIFVGCGSSFSGARSDGGTDSGSACQGAAPQCYNTSSSACCLVNPYGSAVCNNGAWTCGSAIAPGCDESMPKCGGPGCMGTPPLCCPVMGGACHCPSPPHFDFATCSGGAVWVCGADSVFQSACGGGDGGTGGPPPLEAGVGEGSTGVSDGQTAQPCGTSTCEGSSPVCVVTYSQVANCEPPCQSGETMYEGCCAKVSYQCAARPSTCGKTLDCVCAEPLCATLTPGGGSSSSGNCTQVSGDQVTCYDPLFVMAL